MPISEKTVSLFKIGHKAMSMHGSDAAVARMLGASRKQVSRGRLFVQRLDVELRERVETGLIRLAVRQAEELCYCAPPLRRRLTEGLLAGERFSTAGIQKMRQQYAQERGRLGPATCMSTKEMRLVLHKLCPDLLMRPTNSRLLWQVASFLCALGYQSRPSHRLQKFWPLVEAFADEALELKAEDAE